MANSRAIFRVFVSSSFRDLWAERDRLQKVFEGLQAWCREQGAQFQAIDLRWGISEAAGENHATMAICLEELYRCRRITPRPNFILLLGDRYGWQPLPSCLFEEEFQLLLAACAGATAEQDKRLLEAWYARDKNSVPVERVLKPRAEDFDEKLLRTVMQRAADAAFAADDPRRNKYFDAATHQEIRHGALEADQAEEHVFCYFRNLQTLPSAEVKENRDYIDTLEKQLPGDSNQYHRDTAAHDRLDRLKHDLETKFGKSDPPHVHTYPLADVTAISTYLDRLAADVENNLKRIIGRELERRKNDHIAVTEAETNLHAEFGRGRNVNFTGREVELERIRTYVADSANRQPLVICGVGGSGKTALMAEAATRAGAGLNPAVFLTRFLGTTPAASDIRSLLTNLCDEIKRRYPEAVSEKAATPGADAEEKQTSEFQKLTKEFERCLGLSTTARPLVLFLDALDQLNPTEGAQYLGWIPWQQLPEHTKLIVSVLKPDDERMMKKDPRVPDDPAVVSYRVATGRTSATNVVSLAGMSREQGAALLDKWLAHAGRRLEKWEFPEIASSADGVRRAGRKLTETQRNDLLTKFALHGLPLWLKLAFEEVRHWRSSDGLPKGHDDVPGLSETVPGILRDLFWRLEQAERHGPVFVKRALGYLAAGRRGLAEEELIEVLSSDKEGVMKDFFDRSPTEREKPEEQRIKKLPVLIWSRLYSDLEPYLSERAAAGGTVLNFYHRQVADEVRKKYCSGDDEIHCHRQLAAYFGNHDKKPYFLESIEKQRERMKPPYTPRPVDVRKVDELPHHLLQVAKLVGKDDPKAPEWDAVADLLTDFNFLEAKNEAAP